SHILPDVESVADRVAILHHGRLVQSVEPRDLATPATRRVIVRCEGAPILEIPPAWSGRVTRRAAGSDSGFEVAGALELSPVLEWLLRSGVSVRSVIPQSSGLEEIFLAATEDSRPGPQGDEPHGERRPQRARDESIRSEHGAARPEPGRG